MSQNLEKYQKDLEAIQKKIKNLQIMEFNLQQKIEKIKFLQQKDNSDQKQEEG